MTFFLNGPAEMPKIKSQNPDVDLPTWGEGLGAAFDKAQLENDSNFVAARRRIGVKDELAEQVVPRLGMDQIRPLIEERNAKAIANGMPSQVVEIPDNVEDAVALLGPNFSERAIEMARKAAAANPDAWADVDLSDETIEERTNEVLRAEYEDAQQILEMMPGGRGSAELIGGMAGITADVKNLPFLALGGGSGSIVRVMGREASINMAAEAAFLPSQYEMAERLDIPDPSIPTQLLMAAGAGAFIGGGLTLAERGWKYYRGRNRVDPIGRMSDLESQAMVDQVEDILTSDTTDPFGQINRLMEEAGEAAQEPPYRLENPINPERPPLVPEVTTTPLEPVERSLDDNQRADFDRMRSGEIPEGSEASSIPKVEDFETYKAAEQLDDDLNARAVNGEGKIKTIPISSLRTTQGFVETDGVAGAGKRNENNPPVAVVEVNGVAVILDGNHRVEEAIRAGQTEIQVSAVQAAPTADPEVDAQPRQKPATPRPTSLKTFVVREGGIWKGDDTGEIAGMEYRRPGFLKNERRVTSSAGDNKGGLTVDEMRERAVEQGYLPEGATINDFLDALDGDVRGTSRVYAQADAMAAEEWRIFDGEEADTPTSSRDDFEAMEPEGDRFFIDRDNYLFGDDPDGDIELVVRKWMDDEGWTDQLTPEEQREIIAALQERGGDPEYLVERVLEREVEYVESPTVENDVPFGEPDQPRGEAGRADGGGTGRPETAPGEAGGGTARAADGANADRQAESTAAGDQTLIDGVAPITTRDRIQAQQNAPMRGGSAAADDGLFDVGARSQIDMFSDPVSPEAREVQDVVANDLKSEIEADGDFDLEIETPDGGTRVMSARGLLDYLDEGDNFAARIELCGKGPET